MDMEFPVINKDKCTLCGKCVRICPKETLAIAGGSVELTGQECILCTHCYAVCAAGAVSFGTALRSPRFTSFSYREKAVKPGDADAGLLVNIMRSRRSMRRFLDKPVPDDVLRDLVECAVMAPSGSNCQLWQFTVVNGRDKVVGVAEQVGEFFRRINRIAKNPFARYLSVLFMGMTLVRYYRDRYESVERGLARAAEGEDPLFWGAPAVIIIHSSMDGSLPVEDAQYAAYNITLLAHALGLGTCFIGYASETLNRAASIKRALKIPERNRVHAVLAAGYPAAKFTKLALRKEYSVDFI